MTSPSSDRPKTSVDMPSMKPERDEVARRSTQGGRGKQTTGSRGSKPTKSTGGGLLSLVAFIVAIAAAGAAYLLWMQGEQAAQALESATARIAELENQLSSTGDELSESDAAVRVRMKELDTEVRKLWDARKGTKKQVAEQEVTIRNLVTRTTKQQEQLSAAVGQATALSASLDELVEQFEDVDPAQLESAITQVNKQLSTMTKDLESLQTASEDQRQWLESVDAFRRQVNERLNAIQNPAPAAPQLQ